MAVIEGGILTQERSCVQQCDIFFDCSFTEPPVTCPVHGAPSVGSVNTSGQSYTEGSQEVTYQCNDGLFPIGVLIATCARDEQNVVWEPNPSTVVCRTVPGNLIQFLLFINFCGSTQSTALFLPSHPTVV